MFSQDKSDLIEALKANVDGKAKVIEQVALELGRTRALNKACFATMHRMHESYSKPNYN